jgi:hypothetical protein
MTMDAAEEERHAITLLGNIKANLPALEATLEKFNGHWGYEDTVYRFYHQSFKVFYFQTDVLAVVDLLLSLLPGVPLNTWFMEIIMDGTGKEFKDEDNRRWLEATRPLLEAIFHARYFLEMICKYGKQLEKPPNRMPSRWAAVLYVYNLR